MVLPQRFCTFKYMIDKLLLYSSLLLLLQSEAFAQKACFMPGGFIAAFYSEHDQKIKFVNTYTNQAFSSFVYTDGEPELWFAGTQLVVLNQNKAMVASFQKNEKTNHVLSGTAIKGSLLQMIETADSLFIKQIVTGRQAAVIAKKEGSKVVSVAVSADEKKLCIILSAQNETTLSCYALDAAVTKLWELPLASNDDYTLNLSFKGDLLALWGGKKTELINAVTGTTQQTMGNDLQFVRFTVKDDFICINQSNNLVTLFAKNKNGVFKSVQSELYKQGIYPSQTGKQYSLTWEETSVSDDLTMAIGFGNGAVGLYKTGVVMLFF